MNDLLVSEAARGTGVAYALILACADEGRTALSLDWQTTKTNKATIRKELPRARVVDTSRRSALTIGLITPLALSPSPGYRVDTVLMERG